MVLKVGLIGAGYIGGVHARAWSQIMGARLVGVAAKHLNSAARLAAQFGARPYSAIDELIREVDIVDVCAPPLLNEQFVVTSALAGKHVVCEKPLALSLPTADRIIQAVQRGGIKFMVGHVMRFWPEYRLVKALVEDGTIGKPICLDALRLTQPPTWAGWLRDPKRSGGVVLQLMIHDLDFATWVLGTPIGVYATGFPGHVLAAVKYGSGCQAFAEAGWCMPTGFPFTLGLRILGTEGCLEFCFRLIGTLRSGVEACRRLILFRPGNPPEELPVEDKDPYLSELEYFVGCVMDNRDPAVNTLVDARTAVALALATDASLQAGNLISLAPASQYFGS